MQKAPPPPTEALPPPPSSDSTEDDVPSTSGTSQSQLATTLGLDAGLPTQ